ncbi:MAG: class I SAM-dependent RNA methyltransferase [Gemmatimonadetes bacterium]|nr:class I SAM-dependent RNA methyltransferase [Gemmatimonadota bacterium]
MSGPGYDMFAVTAHGLADLCAAELAGLGIAGRVETGGVAWSGSASSLYRANLELRTASRVIARVGEFGARGFAELERRAAKLPWQDFLSAGSEATLRVTCRKSKLYHAGAVAERVARTLAGVGVTVPDAVTGDDDDDAHSADIRGQLIIVRFMRDVCTISVDSSGALLHQRGYRQALAKAPLRETIAAAMLLASGWRGDSPLIDPLCGSGTIPIEAALLARSIAPGIARADLTPRRFAFESWPHFERASLDDVVRDARSRVRPARARIVAADRDAGAVAASRANAERAGVAADIEFRRVQLSDLEPAAGGGHVVTNPPYGVRVGDRRNLRELYAMLGDTIRSRRPGWEVTMLAADDALAVATGLPLTELLATRNGGIPVRLLTTACARTHTQADGVYQRLHNQEGTV